MVRVELDHAELRRLAVSAGVVADLERRGHRVRDAAARRAAVVSHRWAAAMDTETGVDAEGAYVDVSWRRGTGANEEWRGHFFLFGTVQPHHPPHMDVLLGAIDEV